MVIAYCVKCKEKQTIVKPKNETLSNGRGCVKGTCEVCGTKVCALVKGTK